MICSQLPPKLHRFPRTRRLVVDVQSKGGLTFAALIFLGSFSTVWLDQAYW